MNPSMKPHISMLVVLFYFILRRPGGLVVSALDFRSEDRWFEPGLCCPVV